MNTTTFLKPSHSTPTCLWRWNRQSVPKCPAYKTQTLGNYPEESIQHSEHGESVKSRTYTMMMIIKLTDDVTSLQFW